ncbi:hypothetical protein C0584_00325 [Candidatus Parcubacteria bacterium]|mgnify:CR=1 FL=1|nr:MAG: hypothetical protein C0584_00325 [Candidatus Parcubacteria bacterium]
MNIEYEATFPIKDKEALREDLMKVNATLLKKEFLQKRSTFNLPKGVSDNHSWARVRHEGDKITMSVKTIKAGSIEGQEETEIVIDSYDGGVSFLKNTGFIFKSYQETLREKWILDEVEVLIDTWPYLEPIVEIEGKSESAVKKISEILGFDYGEAVFDGIDYFYNKKYGVEKNVINNNTPLITFDSPNPFN